MRIIFVRHAHPDYRLDCLTELGHRQASAVSARLSSESPTEIYASTCGRAYETAMKIAGPKGMEVKRLDFMRELKWGSLTDEKIEYDGQPWRVSDDMVAKGLDITRSTWESEEPFVKNKLVGSAGKACVGFDELLRAYGYAREGKFYRIRRENPDTIIMVSHGGSSSAVLAHILNIPFPQFCAVFKPDFTAITTLKFAGEEGNLITPQVELLNDARHIGTLDGNIIFGN